MAKFILGTKLNMTQKFLENGMVVPVTVVQAGPCAITQVKGEKDGYKAVQIGYGQKNKLSKALLGHLKKLDKFRYLKEFRVESTDNLEKGKVFDVTSFNIGDKLKVSSVSKGKGFQGVVKRHGFHGSPASHGHKDQLRMPGSIGATDAARVFKGTRMGGRMGGDKVTVDNLDLVAIDEKNNLLYIKGATPGARNALVTIVADGDLKFVDPASHKVSQDKKEEVEVKEAKKAEGPEQSRGEEKPAEIKNKTSEVKEDKKELVKEEEKTPEVKEAKKAEGPEQSRGEEKPKEEKAEVKDKKDKKE